jgi:hypothetical protein
MAIDTLHAEAIAAMHIYADTFVGVPDDALQFWDSLPAAHKNHVRNVVMLIRAAPQERRHGD